MTIIKNDRTGRWDAYIDGTRIGSAPTKPAAEHLARTYHDGPPLTCELCGQGVWAVDDFQRCRVCRKAALA